jgi:3-methyladenine DNA glycosylase AlkD
MDAEKETARIVAELRGLGGAERAEYEKRYLKSDFVHFGVPVPAIRKVTVAAVRSRLPECPEGSRLAFPGGVGGRPPTERRPGRDDVLGLAAALWAVTENGQPVHEARIAAIEVLARRAGVLEPGDVAVAEGMIRDSASWVYVDYLADKVVGVLVTRFPGTGKILDAWVADPYLWIRRTALLALLPGIRAGTPDLDRLSRYGDALIGETDFFIRKALGWVLRELSKKDPVWVSDWVASRTGRISGVTLREAVRHLPPEDAARLMAAYKAPR